MSKPKTILIVDDEEPIREILADIFEDEDYTVINAENGKLGLEMALQNEPDLIISDVQMPEMNGVDFLKGLPGVVSKMPQFVFLSGFCDITPDAAQNLGAQGIISKPFDITGIVDVVGDFLLPPSEKWEFTGDYPSVHRTAPMSGCIDASRADRGEVVFGKNGFFMPYIAEELIVGSFVSFDIEIKDGGLDLKGVGQVAWLRAEDQDGSPAGIGVKICGIKGGGAEAYFELIKQAGILSVIPNEPSPALLPIPPVRDCG